MVLWGDIKTSNIQYYDIQYAAERTISSQTKANLTNLYFSQELDYFKSNLLKGSLVHKIRVSFCLPPCACYEITMTELCLFHEIGKIHSLYISSTVHILIKSFMYEKHFLQTKQKWQRAWKGLCWFLYTIFLFMYLL